MQTSIKPEDPAKIYLERLSSNPGDALAHGALGDIYYGQYRENGSRKLRDKAIGKYQDFLRIQKDYTQVSHTLYMLLLEKAVDEGSEEAFEQLSALYSRTPVLNKAGVWPPALVEALMLMGQGKNGQATITALKRAIKQDPGVVRSRILLGSIYIRQGKDDLALVLFEQASRADPDNIDANRLLALLYSGKVRSRECPADDSGTVRKAIHAYKAVIKNTPDKVNAHSDLAAMYKLAGKMQLYEFETRRAMELQLTTDTRWDYAQALAWSGNPEKAQEVYETILGIESRNAGVLMEYSLLHFIQRNWEQAEIAWLEYLNNTSGNYFYGHIRYYLTLHKLSRSDEAERYLGDHVAIGQLKPWEKELYDYMSENISAQQLLGSAVSTCQKTEAEFYIGLKADAENNQEKARQQYHKVLDLGVVAFVEYMNADYFLGSSDFSSVARATARSATK